MHEAPKARRVRGRGGVIRCGAPRCSVVRFVPRALGHGDHPVGRQHTRVLNGRETYALRLSSFPLDYVPISFRVD